MNSWVKFQCPQPLATTQILHTCTLQSYVSHFIFMELKMKRSFVLVAVRYSVKWIHSLLSTCCVQIEL